MEFQPGPWSWAAWWVENCYWRERELERQEVSRRYGPRASIELFCRSLGQHWWLRTRWIRELPGVPIEKRTCGFCMAESVKAAEV